MKKTFGTILLEQVLAAGRFLSFRSRAPKKARKERDKYGNRIIKRYKPGTAGLSMVSTKILKEHGVILSRRERKAKAKFLKQPFVAYYNV